MDFERKLEVNKAPLFLEDQNLENGLIYYEYTLHHELRAASARLHGLIYLLNLSHTEEEEKRIKKLLGETLDEMDKVISDVSQKLSCRKDKSTIAKNHEDAH